MARRLTTRVSSCGRKYSRSSRNEQEETGLEQFHLLIFDLTFGSLEDFKAHWDIEPLVVFDDLLRRHDCDALVTSSHVRMVILTCCRFVTERSAPIYDGLHNFIRQQSESQESDRRDTVEALSAAVEIANRTFQYFSNQRRTGKRDYNKEQMLAQGWGEVGVQLARLKNPPTALIEGFFMKAQYWSSPDDWTAERIAASRIGLEEIAKESRSVLLGRTGGPDHT